MLKKLLTLMTLEPAKLPTQPTSQLPVTSKTSKPSLRAKLADKIRSELNIEKWPAIWQPAKSKNKPALRTMQREILSEDGSRMVSRVEVGYTQLGTLTTEEQKLLYVLIKLWEEGGKPDRQVFFSTRGLARALRKKGWGSNVIFALTKSLRKLRTIPIEWINSYFDQTDSGVVVVDRRPFTILGDLRIVERRQDGAVNSSLGYFQFDDHILANLQRNYTKPVCIEEFFKLRSEIAQLVYSHVDLILADKTRYERRTRELFDDLGLKNPEYQHMFERRRVLERALKELQGIRLSSGVLRTASLEKTKDGKDYKVSFSKGQHSELSLDAASAGSEAAVPQLVINNYAQGKDPLMADAERLVQYFHKVFHQVENHSPLSKETSQALSLLSQHGLARAQAVVDFAYRQSRQSNFQVQHFGAILSYASRAIAELERRKEFAVARPAAVPDVMDQYWTTGERRLACLTAEQLASRYERAKTELLLQNPFLAKKWEEGGPAIDKLIRGRVIRQLAEQPMNLLPMTYPHNVTRPQAAQGKL